MKNITIKKKRKSGTQRAVNSCLQDCCYKDKTELVAETLTLCPLSCPISPPLSGFWQPAQTATNILVHETI